MGVSGWVSVREGESEWVGEWVSGWVTECEGGSEWVGE